MLDPPLPQTSIGHLLSLLLVWLHIYNVSLHNAEKRATSAYVIYSNAFDVHNYAENIIVRDGLCTVRANDRKERR